MWAHTKVGVSRGNKLMSSSKSIFVEIDSTEKRIHGFLLYESNIDRIFFHYTRKYLFVWFFHNLKLWTMKKNTIIYHNSKHILIYSERFYYFRSIKWNMIIKLFGQASWIFELFNAFNSIFLFTNEISKLYNLSWYISHYTSAIRYGFKFLAF